VDQKTTERTSASRAIWESLETVMRHRFQEWMQDLLEQEVTELLGRVKSARRQAVDAALGYRNGFGKPRHLTLSCGTITVRRPRVRGLEGRFESRILPLFQRQTREVRALLPELYLHGLAQGDFDLALRGLLGEKAPLSASSIARLKEKWQGESEAWAGRPLDDLDVVYLWVDGIYIKAGLEKEKAAVLVVLAALSDGTKSVVSLTPGHRESTESWSAVLRDLRARGMQVPRLVIGDGHLGIWAALRNVYPEAEEQRCWNHRILNVLDRIPKKHQAQATLLLRAIPYAETVAEAERLKSKFAQWCRKRGWEEAARVLDRDWSRMVTFYRYPKEHWRHLRTTNPVESPFAALRLRTDAAKRFKKVANASAVIWKMLLVAEKRFRRLNAAELLREVRLGVRYADGVRVKQLRKEEAAA
jgi:transposase-like protein